MYSDCRYLRREVSHKLSGFLLPAFHDSMFFLFFVVIVVFVIVSLPFLLFSLALLRLQPILFVFLLFPNTISPLPLSLFSSIFSSCLPFFFSYLFLVVIVASCRRRYLLLPIRLKYHIILIIIDYVHYVQYSTPTLLCMPLQRAPSQSPPPSPTTTTTFGEQ